jgi:hypothetical protein
LSVQFEDTEQSIKRQQKQIARKVVDTSLDFLVSIALSRLGGTIEQARLGKTIKPSLKQEPILRRVISIGDEPLTQEIKAVIQQKKGIPQTPQRTRQKHHELVDFSDITKDFDTSKKVAKRSSRSYKERKAELDMQLAAAKERAKQQSSDNIAISDCPPSCLGQYEELKKALQIEEITSVVGVTEHGLQRLIERGFTSERIINLLTKPDFTTIQRDGAKAFIRKIDNKYDIMIYNAKIKKVVTALNGTSLKKIQNLGKNHGWII